MEHNDKPAVTPKDFFLWAGAMAALYVSVVSFLILLFEYIDRSFPDPVTNMYVDPYSGAIRFAMASIIVLVPLTVVLLRLIRKDIEANPEKKQLWVRRWALVLTLFIAGATIAIDLITLINTFLGGEISIRFGLKVAVVLLVSAAGFMHFYADLKGYWQRHPGRAQTVGGAFIALAFLAIASGFFIIGSPTDIRLMRLDAQKEGDLNNIQWQVVNFYQTKETLPADLSELNDPLSGQVVPKDPQTGEAYEYERTSDSSFNLCAVFNREGVQNSYYRPYMYSEPAISSVSDPSMKETWQHGVGRTCFSRTIDPERYPPFKNRI